MCVPGCGGDGLWDCSEPNVLVGKLRNLDLILKARGACEGILSARRNSQTPSWVQCGEWVAAAEAGSHDSLRANGCEVGRERRPGGWDDESVARVRHGLSLSSWAGGERLWRPDPT